MIVNSKELFKTARKRDYAYPAPNYVDQLSASSYIAVAEKLNLPVILAYAEAHQKYLSFDEAVEIGLYYAKKAKVPVALHLDHGQTKELIFEAINRGFKSVMIDASSQRFEENVRQTREIVAYAHERGAVVEAEIGHVGGGDEYKDSGNNDNVYTSVEEARRFVELTEVDSLAISIGTAHGAYKGTPVIDFTRLEEVRKAIETPLVLHGGSSSGEYNLSRCATEGISKINIYTDLITAAAKEVETVYPCDYYTLKKALKNGYEKCLEHYYGVFKTFRYRS
ncbi:class II fructose-bisphosphate aldolase [Lacrimispora sp.]|uniref:class II fructose-bisphosphate aldolase n=1 Tax=Lacrimispora sp. TaxID=2719234 RepID=UPI0028A85D26|nr:class II fructose-bisphosphate aldolase [Lacrimispora sp.]